MGHREPKQHLRFVHAESKPRTEVWDVLNAHSGDTIGQIRWDAAWRKYVFDDGVIKFDASCMHQIGDFLEERMKEHKEKILND